MKKLLLIAILIALLAALLSACSPLADRQCRAKAQEFPRKTIAAWRVERGVCQVQYHDGQWFNADDLSSFIK